jgi:hypothetical protein
MFAAWMIVELVDVVAVVFVVVFVADIVVLAHLNTEMNKNE